MSVEQGLFLLLRLGLGNSTDNDIPQDLLTLSLADWKTMMDLAQRQSVCAIAVDGIQTIVERYGNIFSDYYGQESWQPLILEWMSVMLMTEQANASQTIVMSKMAMSWKQGGCRTMLMKGQANGLYYPRPQHRSTGDIDVYLFDGYEKAHDIARGVGAEVNASWYKHSEIYWKNEVFENHRYFVPTRQGKRSKQLDAELKNEIEGVKLNSFPQSCVFVPTAMFNAKFLTFHTFAHFLAEGLRLKQLLDWAMFIQNEQTNLDWEIFYDFCDRYRYRRFADAANAFALQYIGVNVTNPAICCKSPYTEKIIMSALYDDDYVFATGSGWHNRWHLVKNLWRYRWKYRDIYQMSPLRQLWYYASGYLFKTE